MGIITTMLRIHTFLLAMFQTYFFSLFFKSYNEKSSKHYSTRNKKSHSTMKAINPTRSFLLLIFIHFQMSSDSKIMKSPLKILNE